MNMTTSIFQKTGLSKIKNIFNAFRSKATENSGTWEEIINSSFNPGGNDEALQFYRSYAFACINARAENTAKAKLFLFKKQQKDKPVQITEHPFLDLIGRNNIHGLSFFELIFSIIVQLDLFGNSYVYYPKNILGMPADMILLSDPSKVKINRMKDMKLKYILREGTNETEYTSDEIIHFKFPSPVNMTYGKSTISAIIDILKSEIQQSNYQLSFYRNDARPGTVLEMPGDLSESHYNRLITRWNNRYKGSKNSNKVTVLDNGMKISRMDNSPKEIDFINSRREVRDEIFSIFRVPKVVLAITDQVNYANAYAGLTSFILNTIIPLSKFIESKLDSFVKMNYDQSLTLKLEYDTFENEEVKLNQHRMLIETGTITKNELREMVGLGAVKEGNR